MAPLNSSYALYDPPVEYAMGSPCPDGLPYDPITGQCGFHGPDHSWRYILATLGVIASWYITIWYCQEGGKGAIKEHGPKFIVYLKTKWTGIKRVFRGIGIGIGTGIKRVFRGIGIGIGIGIKRVFRGIGNGIKLGFRGIGTGIKGAVSSIFSLNLSSKLIPLVTPRTPSPSPTAAANHIEAIELDVLHPKRCLSDNPGSGTDSYWLSRDQMPGVGPRKPSALRQSTISQRPGRSVRFDDPLPHYHPSPEPSEQSEESEQSDKFQIPPLNFYNHPVPDYRPLPRRPPPVWQVGRQPIGALPQPQPSFRPGPANQPILQQPQLPHPVVQQPAPVGARQSLHVTVEDYPEDRIEFLAPGIILPYPDDQVTA